MSRTKNPTHPVLSDCLKHGFLALLLGSSLLCVLLKALSMEAFLLPTLGVLAVTVAVLALCSIRKPVMILALILFFSLLCWYLFFQGGLVLLTDAVLSFHLTLTGMGNMISFFGREVSIYLCLVTAFLTFLFTAESAGNTLSCLTLVLLLILSWRTGGSRDLALCTPAVLCVVLQSMDTRQITFRRVLPVALSLTMLPLILVPPEGITLQPLKDAAETVRQRILDYLFYTEPRNVFSLASEGYYPLGSETLGGSAAPDGSLVMVVKTPVTVYLRGTAKNTYTGKTWTDTTGGRRYLWVSPRWLTTRSAIFDTELPDENRVIASIAEPVTVSVQMLSSSASDLFVPQRVRDLSCGGDLIPYFNSASEIFATRDLASGDTWTVTAPVWALGGSGVEDLVLQCEPLGDDATFDAVADTYTALPDHLSARLYDLAREITSGADTDYRRVTALAAYLRTNCRYTLDVSAVPSGKDFVSYFLLESREGYCTYFATAMTVLCRMVGIPARYVEGYVARPSTTGTAYITGEDGHAWTEVYFRGFGWLTVDATPASGSNLEAEDQDSDTSNQALPSVSPSPSPLPTATPTPTISSSPGPEQEAPSFPTFSETPDVQTPAPEPAARSPYFPHEGLLSLLLLALLILAVYVRIRMTLPDAQAKRKKTETEVWLVYLQEITDVLHARHLKRDPCETPECFLQGLADSLCPDLAQVGSCSSGIFYGHVPPDEEAVALCIDVSRHLYMHLSPLQRLRVICFRAFVPLSGRQL